MLDIEEIEEFTDTISDLIEEEVKIRGGPEATYLVATGFYTSDDEYRLDAKTNMTQEDVIEIILKYLKENPEMRAKLLSGLANQIVNNKVDELVKPDPVYDPSFSDIIKRMKF